MKLKHALLVLSAALSFNAYAQAPIVIKFSHVVATDTPKGRPQSVSSNWPKRPPMAA
jgi:C4-dicarboxylate-binding protein DctP